MAQPLENAMHEMSLVASLMELIEETVARHGVRKVERVFLQAGRMASVEPMTLRSCFEALSEGTAAQGADLVIEEVPVQCSCRECTRVYRVERYDFRCPVCGSGDTELISGRELRLDRLEAAA